MHQVSLVLIAIALLACAGCASAITLARDGASQYAIAIPADADAPTITAAEELQKTLKAVTGAALEIAQEDGIATDARVIAVGPGERFRKACPDVDLASLQRDGIVIRTVGDDLFLAGGSPRGTLYAVYTFLEDSVGCRWWAADAEFIPQRPTLEIGELNTVYVPKLQYREAFYRGVLRNPLFAAKLKLNGHFEGIPASHGGHYSIIGWCHTFYQILPPEKYFAAHPDWYSEIGGRRVHEGAQLCLTNSEMRAEFIRVALERIRQQPDAGIISVSQNDWHGRCQCDKCRALEEAEGAPSGALVHFVNAVAEEIEKEFPDVLVETLAYQYTRQAPEKVKPRRNVIIRLCSIECDFSKPLETGETNETFARDVAAWSAIAPQLYVWDYVTNFASYIMPHPNLRVLAPNIRFFVNNKTIGLFEQGDASCSCSDFPELRAWLLAKLMWDPSLDDKALIREFMQGYYGPAAEPLLQYIELYHDAIENSGKALRCYMSGTIDWLPLADMNAATKLFAEAARAVEGDQVLSDRVRRARLPLDHSWILGYNAFRRQAAGEKTEFLGPDDPQAMVRDFIETAERFDVNSFREGQPFSNYAPMLERRFRAAGPPPEMCKDLPVEDWVDVQDNDFTLHNAGTWVSLVEDPKACDGWAARMTTNHTQWATQYPITRDVESLGKSHCYALVKCAAKDDAAPGFEAGIYDNETRSGLAGQTIPAADCAGDDYVLIDLGVHQLKTSMYVWFAPKNNPDQIESISIDRIFFIREK